MTSGFRRTRRFVEVRLNRDEARMLRALAEGLLDLLKADTPAPEDPLEALVAITEGPAVRPTDPALARLLPDAYRDDAEAAAEFRRYTEQSLRAGKRGAARTMLATLPAGGGRVELDDPAAQAWLSVLNDLRLALGTRLDVTEETYDEIRRTPRDDPRLPDLLLYEWLGFLEESLVTVLAGW